MRGRRARVTALAALCLAAAAAGPAVGQRRGAREAKEAARRQDPYTRNEPDALARAGYVSLGPFTFGDHDTLQIEHVLGASVRVQWVETAHFKIGSSLPAYTIPRPNKAERRKIRAELERLAERIPAVARKVRTRQLDPWLRLHLFAQRAEEFYAEFRRRAGVEDASFPRARGEKVGGRYMGEGPYLGQPGKYLVLLFQKQSTFGHYSRTFLGAEADSARRENFVQTGNLFYGTAVEFSTGTHRTDTGVHAQMVYSLCHNLLDGFKFYSHRMPLWFAEGLAHWYSRRIDPRIVNVGDVHYELDPKMAWDWAPRVRARVEHGIAKSSEELFALDDPARFGLVDHMMAWSRVDFLTTLPGDGFAVFLDMMKGRIPMHGRAPTREEILARQEQALREAWGLDAAELDRRWARWVRKTYPRKR